MRDPGSIPGRGERFALEELFAEHLSSFSPYHEIAIVLSSRIELFIAFLSQLRNDLSKLLLLTLMLLLKKARLLRLLKDFFEVCVFN